jgi:hypothetical protein
MPSSWRLGVIWFEFDGLAVGRYGFPLHPLIIQRVAELYVRFEVSRLELDSLAIRRLRRTVLLLII